VIMRKGGTSPLAGIKAALNHYSMINALVLSAIRTKEKSASYPQQSAPPVDVMKSAAKAYLNNHILLEQFSRLTGSRYFAFLQPAMFDNKKQLTPHERELKEDFENKFAEPVFWAALEQFYEFAHEQSGTLPFFYDISDVFLDTPEQLYHDRCHYNDAGNRIIVRRIIQTIDGYVAQDAGAILPAMEIAPDALR
ncbi:MAG TPA: hypothetical protein PLP17_07760, partial [Oligoflexia bacterium]|nr:hypothetical protein [Oligoflexia bacterium]